MARFRNTGSILGYTAKMAWFAPTSCSWLRPLQRSGSILLSLAATVPLQQSGSSLLPLVIIPPELNPVLLPLVNILLGYS
jgi:hypothetical protein